MSITRGTNNTLSVAHKFDIQVQGVILHKGAFFFFAISVLSLLFVARPVQAQPKLTVTAPLDWTVARPNVKVEATCTQTSGGAPEIKVYFYHSSLIKEALLTSGYGKVNKIVDLGAYEKQFGWEAYLRVRCRDALGKEAVVTLLVKIESSSKLKEVRTVGGYIHDVDDQRILFEQGGELKIHDRLTWRETVVFSGYKDMIYGYLSPYGALFVVDKAENDSRAYHWTGGKLVLLCDTWDSYSLVTKGGYAVWACKSERFSRNLATGTNTRIETGIFNSSSKFDHNVASNGFVCYRKVNSKNQNEIFSYYKGQTRKIASGVGCTTDGTNIVYTKYLSLTKALALYTNTGEIILATDAGKASFPAYSSYNMKNGWVEYLFDNGSGTFQIYVRSPGGKTSKVTNYPKSVDGIFYLGPNGEVWVSYYYRLYLYKTGSNAVDVSYEQHVLYIGKKWHMRIGRSLFEVSPYSPYPDGGSPQRDMGPPDLGPDDMGPVDLGWDGNRDGGLRDVHNDAVDAPAQSPDLTLPGLDAGNGCGGCSLTVNAEKKGTCLPLVIPLLAIAMCFWYARARKKS